MHTFWGQFLDHDIMNTPAGDEALPIPILPDDPVFNTSSMTFTRSKHMYDDANVRHPVNYLTSYIDGNSLYGASEERLAQLRDAGRCKLRSSFGPINIPGDLLPFNLAKSPMDNDGHFSGKESDETIFLAGDVRANENPVLASLHTVFLREHNRLCDVLANDHPDSTEDELFHHARRLVVAYLQQVSFVEYLSSTLGRPLPPYTGYQPGVNAGIDNFFQSVAFRYGHSEVPNELPMFSPNLMAPLPSLELRECYFNPGCFIDYGIDPVIFGAAITLQEEVDIIYSEAIRNFLFGCPMGGGTDLFSRNVQRARDHGIPGW